MARKKVVSVRTGSIQTNDGMNLDDHEIEDMVGLLWENVDGLPTYIQTLLQDSREPGKTGAVSYALVAGWVLGKFEYDPGSMWDDKRGGGWVPKEKDVN